MCHRPPAAGRAAYLGAKVPPAPLLSNLRTRLRTSVRLVISALPHTRFQNSPRISSDTALAHLLDHGADLRREALFQATATTRSILT